MSKYSLFSILWFMCSGFWLPSLRSWVDLIKRNRKLLLEALCNLRTVYDQSQSGSKWPAPLLWTFDSSTGLHLENEIYNLAHVLLFNSEMRLMYPVPAYAVINKPM